MKQVLVVGAGAAGLMAAGILAKGGAKVLVLEHMDSPGRKLLITGKGRCNVTNDCGNDEFLAQVRRNPRFLYSALSRFSTADTMAFFEGQGVPLKVERGRRVFPQSDHAADILAALQRHAAGAKPRKGEAVRLLLQNGRVTGVALPDGQTVLADAVLLCTGGLSYPGTGSTGLGYAMAKQAGHTIIPPAASLVPLRTAGGCAELMGLSLKNVRLTLLQNGRGVFSEQGEMLFTHFGLSGPLVLSASAHMGEKGPFAVSVDLKPALSLEELDRRIARDFEKYANKDAANSLGDLLPKKLIPVILRRWGVLPDKKVHQITKEERRALAALLKDLCFEVTGKDKIEHAVITAGGVSTKEVSPGTMASKLASGLYFAGEILDVDGYTGGFNLQIAFSTAVCAAEGILKELAE